MRPSAQLQLTDMPKAALPTESDHESNDNGLNEQKMEDTLEVHDTEEKVDVEPATNQSKEADTNAKPGDDVEGDDEDDEDDDEDT